MIVKLLVVFLLLAACHQSAPKTEQIALAVLALVSAVQSPIEKEDCDGEIVIVPDLDSICVNFPTPSF